MSSSYDFRAELLAVIPNLRAFAMSLVGAADKADDLVQETLVRAWDKRSSFTPGTNLKGWLFTILRNEFYSQMRKRKREVPDPEGAMSERLSIHPEQVGRMDMEDFKKAVNTLPEDQREALILVGASGFSYEEAAEICQCAVGTIKSRVSRARAQLARTLHLEGDGEYGPDAVSVGVMNLNSTTAI